MGVVGERLDDVRARVDEVPVEAFHQIRVLEHDHGDEGAGLEVAAALELEQVALGADHGPLGEPREQPGPAAWGLPCVAFFTFFAAVFVAISFFLSRRASLS